MEKGRTKCPNCNKEIILNMPDKISKFEINCPNCSHKFFIQCTSDDIKSKEECHWIEHGEPRKTVLSSLKPKTNKPKIAGFLLLCVLIIGLFTTIFSEAFIVSSLNIATSAGFTGTVRIKVIDLSNNSIENANIEIEGINRSTNKDGIFSVDNVKLGIQTIVISKQGYKIDTIKKLVTPFFNFETTVRLRDGEGHEEKAEYESLACSMFLIIFLIFTLLAALACLKRRHLDIALFGSFISIFTFGFFFIGSIFSIIAFILIYKSMEEFENGKKGKFF